MVKITFNAEIEGISLSDEYSWYTHETGYDKEDSLENGAYDFTSAVTGDRLIKIYGHDNCLIYVHPKKIGLIKNVDIEIEG